MSGIKSRPRYRPLALDTSGARHLLLSDAPDVMVDGFADVETWVIAADSRAIPGRVDLDEATPRLLRFRSAAQMLARLAARLDAERMGLRLYAVGTESFLWDVFNIGQAAGMGRREIHLTHAGSASRRVICVHCGTTMEGVTTSIIPCAGCRAALFVRDHFSRRMAGFQGVQVDAEVPGEIPPAEELYR